MEFNQNVLNVAIAAIQSIAKNKFSIDTKYLDFGLNGLVNRVSASRPIIFKWAHVTTLSNASRKFE